MKRLTIVAILFIFIGVTCFCQEEKPMYEIHAAMLHNFMKHIHWPDESEGGEFVLGILGENDVFNTMKARYVSSQLTSLAIVI